MESFWQAVRALCVQIEIRYRRIFPSQRSIARALAVIDHEQRLAAERARYFENKRRQALDDAARALRQGPLAVERMQERSVHG